MARMMMILEVETVIDNLRCAKWCQCGPPWPVSAPSHKASREKGVIDPK